ncbi:MAG TPA: DUF4381 domain-containing protein [Rhodanobacteraceae bacterium]|nr:DUF4381 domain-containing protein [Rhodanobacteraceae bacterium]
MSAGGPVLRDIHLPQVPWWPPAIGWWVLAALLLVVICASVIFVIRARGRMRPRRAVRRELGALASRFARDGDAVALAAGLSRLLRRIALMLEPAAAARNADAWRAFLQQRAPDAFNGDQLAALLEAPYRAHAVFDGEALLAATDRWCASALQRRIRQPT